MRDLLGGKDATMCSKNSASRRQVIGSANSQGFLKYFIGIYDQAQLSRKIGLDRDDWYYSREIKYNVTNVYTSWIVEGE